MAALVIKRRWMLRLMLLVVAAAVHLPRAVAVSGRSAARHKLEVQRHLKRPNKQAFTSIKSPDGDIIDCVHVSHQTAFDHPFLKNHTIQMKPAFYPEEEQGCIREEDSLHGSTMASEREVP